MAEEEPEIAVDSSSEVDSAYGDDSSSELTSIRSSVMNYHFENGRRYNSFRAGSYWGPNDDKAMENMDLGHHVFTMLLGGKLHLAPITENPQRVLDVGTGSGSWAIDFADLHPSTTVVGTDLSPTQPSWVPPNVQFQVDDCCDEWLDSDSYDFVHIRNLLGSVADWDKFYKEALKSLKPGGYIEQLEPSVEPTSDDGSTKGTVFEEWGRVSLEAGDKFGKTLRVLNESRQKMVDAGFVDVVERRFKLPLAPWPKDSNLKKLGLYNRLYCIECMQDWTMMLLTRVLGWTRDEVEVYLMRARQGLRNPKIHVYQEVTVVWGRKPE